MFFVRAFRLREFFCVCDEGHFIVVCDHLKIVAKEAP